MRFLWLIFPLWLGAFEFKIATYNIENLFDANRDGNEYKEYTPHSKHGWNEAMVEKKIANIARVIKDIDADVIALVEVENRAILEALNRALGDKKYPYLFYPTKKPRVSIETALLSRFPIEKTNSLFIKDQPRGIHAITLRMGANTLDVYLNHWPAMREKEEERLHYASTLHHELLKKEGKEYILLGDFNSPLQVQKDDWGMAFTHVLKASGNQPLRNLWYEVSQEKRYSHSYGKKRSALDHIIVPQSLDDGKGIEYKKGSFEPFIRPYLLSQEGIPNRWEISDRGKGKHLGVGFSDHFPITAIFHTSPH